MRLGAGTCRKYENESSQCWSSPPEANPAAAIVGHQIERGRIKGVYISAGVFFFWEADVVDALSAAGNPGMAGLYIHTKIYEWIGLVDRWAAPVCVFYPAPECFGRSD